jgi:hypothetical protein
MSNKYLILEFKNAGLFRKDKHTKDISFNHGEKVARTNIQEYVEPITVQHISNMLHVLFGQRPVPMNRYVFYNKNSYLYEKAEQSYLNITSLRDKKNNFISETIQLNKAVYNAWNPVSYMNWERVEKLLEKELFEDFIRQMNDILKINCLSITFNSFKKMLLESKNDDIDKVFLELNQKGKKPLFDSIYGKDRELANINRNKRTLLTVVRGVDTIYRLNGEIIVPVSDEDIETIRKGKGFSKLLDGGLVCIKKVVNENRLELNDDYLLVKDISLEKQ